MNQKQLELAKDPDLAGAWAAIQRAAKRAKQVAASTNTDLIVFRNGKCVRVKPNRHGASTTPNDESACTCRFPLPIPDGTTSHSSMLLKDSSQVAGYPPRAGEGENESLRDFHCNEEQKQ